MEIHAASEKFGKVFGGISRAGAGPVLLSKTDFPPRVERMAFSVKETALLLGVSEKTVRRLVERQLLHPCRALRHLLFSRKEVDRFLDQTKKPSI